MTSNAIPAGPRAATASASGRGGLSTVMAALWITAVVAITVSWAGAQDAQRAQDYATQAAGATATASTEIVGFKRDHVASMAIDGETRGDYWASDFIFDTAQGPQWLEVDLGQPRRVGQIVLHMVSKRTALLLEDFSLSVEVEGDWKMVAEVEDYRSTIGDQSFYERYAEAAGQSGVYRVAFDPVVTRRVRVDIPVRTARVHEIQVLPPAEPVEPLTGSIRDAGQVLKFDFGTNRSTLADGWLPVTADTTYSEEAGYGWRSVDDILPVDRVVGYDVTRDFVAAAREDNGSVKNTFSVDVPNGEYLLGIVSGDPAYEVRPFSVAAEGETVAEEMVTPASAATCRLNATVQVEDGALDLTFGGDLAWVISALVLAPTNQFVAVDERLTEVEHQFALGSPDLVGSLTQATPEPPETPAAPTGEEQARGYQVFAPSAWMEHVYPSVPPAEGERIEQLEALCTAGEAEPMTFAVHALEPVRDLSVSVSDLAGPQVLPSSAVEIHRVQCWPQRFKSARKDEWAVMPELLREMDGPGEIWVRPGRNQQFWLTVNVPEDAAPGEYSGSVTVSAGAAGSFELPLDLTVYPFELDWPRPMAWGIYYQPVEDDLPHAWGDEERMDQLILADLRNMRSHGLNSFSIWLGKETVDLSTDPVSFDLTHLEQIMDLVQQVGGFDGAFPLMIRSVWQADEDGVELIPPFIRAVEDARAEHGWPEFLYYPEDEPFRGERLDAAVDLYKACSEVEGIRTYCTVSAEAAERLAPWLDVRCHASSVETRQEAQWPEIQQNAVADGDEFWWYSNATREYPTVMRFKAGFHHWKSRATGQSYWNYRNIGGSAFCDFDQAPGDHISVYPGVEGPIRTIQWEAQREGIDDAKYAYTLETLIQRAEESDDAQVREAAAHAGEVLEDIRERAHIKLAWYVEKYGRRGFHVKSDWDPEQYDATRRQIAEQIIALLEAGAGQ